MAAVMLAIFMTAIDAYIVATAMPTIVADLGGFRLFSWMIAIRLSNGGEATALLDATQYQSLVK